MYVNNDQVGAVIGRKVMLLQNSEFAAKVDQSYVSFKHWCLIGGYPITCYSFNLAVNYKCGNPKVCNPLMFFFLQKMVTLTTL